jgi:WD40 repeat protein
VPIPSCSEPERYLPFWKGYFQGEWDTTVLKGEESGLWDTVTYSKPHTINGHSDGVIDLMFTRDGETVVSAGLDYSIGFWPVVPQLERTAFGDAKRSGQVVFGDNNVLASLREGVVHVWNLTTGEERPFDPRAPDDVECISLSRDGLLGIKAANAIEIWNFRERTKELTLSAPTDFIVPEAGTPLVFSRDGRVLVLGGLDANVSAWNLDQKSLINQFSVPAAIKSLAVNSDGNIVATAGDEKVVRLWDTRTGTELRALTGPIDTLFCVAFSPDDELVAAGGFDNAVRVWRWQRDSKPWQEFSDAASSVFAILFSDDNRTVFSGDGHGFRLWDVGTWEQRFRFESESYIYHLAISPDATAVAGGAAHGPIEVWRFAQEREVDMTNW